MSGASSGMWFAHRLNDWSKLAKERVKRATDGSQDSATERSEKTSTSSDDGSMQRDSQKSANSSFEVQSSFYDFFFRFFTTKFIVRFQDCNVKTTSPSSSLSSSSVLQHQSKSFPPRHLQRTSSISSESSLENLHQVT